MGEVDWRSDYWPVRGVDANIRVHGHYHNARHFSVGGKGIYVFGTLVPLIPGSAWFEKKLVNELAKELLASRWRGRIGQITQDSERNKRTKGDNSM